MAARCRSAALSDLFERPQHTFVGHFIGSPGMNFLPARRTAAGLDVAGRALQATTRMPEGADAFTLGVRPEYVTLADAGDAGAVPAQVTQAQDIGTYWLVSATRRLRRQRSWCVHASAASSPFRVSATPCGCRIVGDAHLLLPQRELIPEALP